MSLGAIATSTDLGDLAGTFAFTVDDERFVLTVDGDSLVVREGTPPTADVTVTTSLEGFFALATRALSATAAARRKIAAIDGDPAGLDALLKRVHLPTPAG